MKFNAKTQRRRGAKNFANLASSRLCAFALMPVLLTALLLLTPGCGEKESDFQPLSGGFGFKAKWVGVDSGPGAGLYYKTNQAKPVVIWPFLDGPLLHTNDLVFFVGGVPDMAGRFGSIFYFAAQAPGPALDVSEDVLKLWAESNHLDFAKIRGRYSPLTLKPVENGVEVHYLGYAEDPPATFEMSWEQVSNIIQDVKQTGKRRVIDSPQHVVYLKKNYSTSSDTK